MLAALKLVYRYRQLAGKCETGAGLDFDEIGELTAIEASFAGETQRGHGDRRIGERDFARAPVVLGATMLRRRFRDAVTILDVGPGGCVCEGAPLLQEGDRVEIVIDASADDTSIYRFMAEVAWTRDRENDCVLGFRFVGIPLELRRRAREPGAADAPTRRRRASTEPLAEESAAAEPGRDNPGGAVHAAA